MDKIRRYFVNPIESRQKDLSILETFAQPAAEETRIIEGFVDLQDDDLARYCKENSLAMNADDLREVVRYFRLERRNPYETELKILDTYWSDHCRHTTFNTSLEDISIEKGLASDSIEASLELRGAGAFCS